MNTKSTSQNLILDLEPPPTSLPEDIPILLSEPLPNTSSAPRWYWHANHLTHGREPVTGGAEQVRMLVSAIDGESWPWTIIMNANDSAWFQVIGTHNACVLEIATPPFLSMVARTNDENATYHQLPPGCRHWIPSCWSDELFTSQEAAEIGFSFLQGTPFSTALTLRNIHLGSADSRTP